MPRSRALLASLLAALAVVLATPLAVLPAVSDLTAPIDASQQGGDPYFPWDGNGGYDVRHYRIDTTFTPKDGRLRGRTTLSARAGDRSLRSFSLDLVLSPDWVRVEGEPARYHKPHAHELVVTPAAPVTAGSDFTVSVGYHGRPARLTATGVRPFVWSPGEAMAIGEPQIGAWWFAANETPRDKASFDVTLRVPRGRQAISNGHLVERAPGPRWTAWRWRQHRPIVTYLAFFAAGRFEVRRSVVDGRPTVYAVSKRLSEGARDRSFRLLRRTPPITRWLQQWLGPYPYDTNGGVVSSLWAGFALENAGRPTYPYVGGPGDSGNVRLVVHELAHQWFGNDVSLWWWQDIWLNEGLATYAEWAYAEEMWGEPVHERLREEYTWRTGAFWQRRISDPGAGHLFAEPVYERGAMAVAALRCRIGEAQLNGLLRQWVRDNAGGHGTMTQFRDLAAATGHDLDEFFAAWLDEPVKPEDTAANGLSGCL